MINEVFVQNFRCYRDLRLQDCARINVIVGDNGAGKTALLEAIFLALGTSPELALRYRAQRGLEGNFAGSHATVEQALWKDLFADWNSPIRIVLRATGEDNRSVEVSYNLSQEQVLSLPGLNANVVNEKATGAFSSGLNFRWVDHHGRAREQSAQVSTQGIAINGPADRGPDFYYLPSTGQVSSAESAAIFSTLSLRGEKAQLVDEFRKEYPWISDISVEVYGGAPVLFASVQDGSQTAARPLGYVSGGVNKVLYVMLCVASRPNGVVLLDEIENGLYYKHRPAIWRMLLNLSKRYNTQLFLTTHSYEWLEALSEASSSHTNDIALWRAERTGAEPHLRRFAGKQAFAAIAAGGEIR